MKPQKLSILFGSIGIFTIIIYTYKFFIKTDFTSMWLIGCAMGFSLIAIAYVYSWMKEVDLGIEKLNKRIDAFSNWFTKKEFEK